MKWLTFILILFALDASAQITKRDIAPVVLTFTSGCLDGFAEALRYHYDAVDDRLDLNDRFWNPCVSWTNKYKDGNPDNGPAYFGSTTFLAWTTDGYHLTRMMRNVTMVTAVTIKIGDRQKWYYYLIEAAAFYVSYCIGFNFTYDVIFRKR